MTQTTSLLLREDVEFLNLGEMAEILRVSAVSVYRLAQRRAIPVYRVCHKLLFRRRDVLAYLDRKRVEAVDRHRL